MLISAESVLYYRVHLSGCYISKMTYMREGERSFTDHEFCRAWHVVTYYRLIRFLPGGLVVMNTTADSPQEAVKVMGLNMAHGYVGQYKTVDNRVICVVKKIEPPAPIQDLNQPTYKRKKRKNERPYVFEVPEMVLHFVSLSFLRSVLKVTFIISKILHFRSCR